MLAASPPPHTVRPCSSYEHWFSAAVLALVFARYALVLIPAPLVVGQLSEADVGPRVQIDARTGTSGIITGMSRTETPWGPWEPANPAEVAQIFNRSQARWWIAGGYAIEMAVGRSFREHSDIDVLLLRPDQLAVQRVLPSWQWHAADPPGTLRPWQPDEQLPAGVHDIWCRPGADQPWRIQVMLDESCAGDWVSRRDQRIRRPVTSLGSVTAEGIPYLAPEIQLFYKAGNPRPKDEIDLAVTLPILTPSQRQWLGDALRLAYGADHAWYARVRSGNF